MEILTIGEGTTKGATTLYCPEVSVLHKDHALRFFESLQTRGNTQKLNNYLSTRLEGSRSPKIALGIYRGYLNSTGASSVGHSSGGIGSGGEGEIVINLPDGLGEARMGVRHYRGKERIFIDLFLSASPAWHNPDNKFARTLSDLR